jgi:hypothetical protein
MSAKSKYCHLFCCEAENILEIFGFAIISTIFDNMYFFIDSIFASFWAFQAKNISFLPQHHC